MWLMIQVLAVLAVVCDSDDFWFSSVALECGCGDSCIRNLAVVR